MQSAYKTLKLKIHVNISRLWSYEKSAKMFFFLNIINYLKCLLLVNQLIINRNLREYEQKLSRCIYVRIVRCTRAKSSCLSRTSIYLLVFNARLSSFFLYSFTFIYNLLIYMDFI